LRIELDRVVPRRMCVSGQPLNVRIGTNTSSGRRLRKRRTTGEVEKSKLNLRDQVQRRMDKHLSKEKVNRARPFGVD
jgi:hypothetical protein